MRRTRRSGLLVAAAIATTFLMAPVALAADATGCSGEATSFDTVGIPIDTAAAPGEGGTQEDPLDILWAGTIEWSGSTDEVLQNGSYEVSVAPTGGGKGLERLISGVTSLLPGFSGDVTNADGKQSAEGTVVPGDVVGVPMATGTYSVKWTVTGEAGSCTGIGYVTITDNPMSSVAWWVALTLIVFGFTGLLLARPTVRPGKG